MYEILADGRGLTVRGKDIRAASYAWAELDSLEEDDIVGRQVGTDHGEFRLPPGLSHRETLTEAIRRAILARGCGARLPGEGPISAAGISLVRDEPPAADRGISRLSDD